MRQKFQKRVVLVKTPAQVSALLALIPHLPVDFEHPIQATFSEEVKVRKPDQNSLMWVGPLADIADQAWVDGRTYCAETWHEHFKRQYLPEEFDPELCKEGYQKWDYTPTGERVLIGSTTQLTIKGFAQYLTQVQADGANMGVMFHENPRERMAA
ncbi:MAG: hypothetical protein EPN62_00935 [Candidimonas sp.]|nr:MAG: hypothetical protein EPN77_01935 [Candidimonas sp.]TAM26892.1 MAG: hypothetical protein EPN62_00935 [Candidimonas sp.]